MWSRYSGELNSADCSLLEDTDTTLSVRTPDAWNTTLLLPKKRSESPYRPAEKKQTIFLVMLSKLER